MATNTALMLMFEEKVSRKLIYDDLIILSKTTRVNCEIVYKQIDLCETNRLEGHRATALFLTVNEEIFQKLRERRNPPWRTVLKL